MPANNQATRLDVTFQVIDGKVCPPITELPLADGFYEAEFDRKRYMRSDKQNRYYRGVVVPLLAAHWGYTPRDMAMVLQQTLLKETLIPKFDRRRRNYVYRSTLDLDTLQCEDFLAMCRSFGRNE